MGLTQLAKSRNFKVVMSRLYGWGASIVILGALFKINHYPGADWMLVVGLGMESIIFFFSAFETPPVDPDWSLVYPQLAQIYHEGKSDSPVKRPIPAHSSGITHELDKMFEQAKVDPELIESLGTGLRKFSENAARLSDLTSAAVVSDDFINNMQKASSSVEKLAESTDATEDYLNNIRNATQKVADLSNVYSQTTVSLKSDMQATSEFAGAIKHATQSASDLAETYSKSAENISKTSELLGLSKLDSESYSTQLKKVASNLSALNTVYELQLQNIEQQVESTKKIQSSVGNFINNVEQTSENMNKYKEEVDMLTRKIAALNSVYGNMLTAMNVTQK